ncbi:COG3904 family protein [Agrobacterium tumefaciens]|uniref:COG3904 family protein n=1 Tax=Agrobacterium tumefaciens TaxID=358 RepID=UPI000975D79D|nr:hypothetical protein BV900_22700 [Agrobacterium tumefaciens]
MKCVALALACVLGVSWQASALELETGKYEDTGTRYVRVTGSIRPGDALVLRGILGAEPDPAVVIFNSPGGSVTEALQMGRDIRRHAASTYVGKGQQCVSACILAFVGGVRRAVGPGGELGSHQFYWPDGQAPAGEAATAMTQKLSASVLRHFIALDVDPEALTLIMETPPEKMLVFKRDLLERFRLVGEASEFSKSLSVVPEGEHRPGCPFPETYLNSDPLNLYPACRG